MPLLFSYGTLQQSEVQQSLFGRALKGEPDNLLGYTTFMLEITDSDVIAKSGKTHHPIVNYTGNPLDFVAGSVFEVTEAELIHADQYEVADYHRVLANLASGKSAWVYVAR